MNAAGSRTGKPADVADPLEGLEQTLRNSIKLIRASRRAIERARQKEETQRV
jgi:hypothetical protein